MSAVFACGETAEVTPLRVTVWVPTGTRFVYRPMIVLVYFWVR